MRHHSRGIAIVALALMMTVSPWGILGAGRVLAQTIFTDAEVLQLNFKCYVIARGNNVAQRATLLGEQFFPDEDVTVREAQLFCSPVTKCQNGDCDLAPADLGIQNIHFKCYNIVPAGPPVLQSIDIRTQFGDEENVLITAAQYLCEGANKILPE